MCEVSETAFEDKQARSLHLDSFHADHRCMHADLERELLSIDRDEKKLIKEIKDAAKCAYYPTSPFPLAPLASPNCIAFCMQLRPGHVSQVHGRLLLV